MIKTKESSKQLISNIHIAIDKKWRYEDFTTLFLSFKKLYEVYYTFHTMTENYELVKNIKYGNAKHSFGLYEKQLNDLFSLDDNVNIHNGTLIIDAIEYHSPGYTDISGLASIVGHIKEILFNYLPNKKTRKELEILEQERIKMMIENYQNIGFDNITIQKLIFLENINLAKLTNLIDDEKISSIN